MSELVHISDQDRVRTIVWSRENKKNALTQDMYTATCDAMADAESGEIRVVILAGAGGNFTAGNDLADFQSGNLSSGGEPPVFRFLRMLREFRKPLIAAVDGVAIGVGTTLLAHCDFVVASHTAKFAMPFVNLGLVPEAGSSYLMPKIMGHARASELLLWGEPFDATTAHAYGLVNRVVDSAEVVSTAGTFAQRLAQKPPEAVRLTKDFLRRHDTTLQRVMEEEGAMFASRLASPEAQEAFAAFMERRPADFSRFK